MKLLNLYLVFSLFILFAVSVYVVSADYKDCSIYGNCQPAKTSITFNNNTGNVNSSNFWDALNTPADISGSQFWYNHTQATTLQQAYDNGGNVDINLSGGKDLDFYIPDATSNIIHLMEDRSAFWIKDSTNSELFGIRKVYVGLPDEHWEISSINWVPGLDNVYDFGSPNFRWKRGYFAEGIYGNSSATSKLTISLNATSGNITTTGIICDSNGCIGSGSSGNIFNQNLNTTNNVAFMNITINNSIKDANSNSRMYYDVNGTFVREYFHA